jgi:hypothetical protein
MRVLYLPLNNLEIKQEGMYDAFRRAGVELHIYDYYVKHLQRQKSHVINDEFLKEVERLKPDLIHCQLQFTGVIYGETLRRAKNISPNSIITDWTGDIRIGVEGPFIDASRGTDWSLISSVGQLELYRKHLHCPNVDYWQIGYNPAYYFEKNNKEFKYDISFVAANYKSMFPDAPLRTQAVSLIRDNRDIRFGLFGSGWTPSVPSITQKQANDVYNDSLCCLSISNFNDVYLYFSDRLLMCLASGRPTLCYRFPGWEHYFTHMKDIIIINNLSEIPNYVRMLKSDTKLADSIGKAGAELARREHTYFSRTLELLRKVGLK